MKVVIIESIITPFEIARFNVINEKLDNNLLIFFQNQTDINKNWKLSINDIRFKYTLLPDLPLRIGRKDIFTLHTNYTTFSELKKADPDVVISCGWDSLASYMSYLYSKRYNKKFILWAGSTINEPSWRRIVSNPYVKCIIRNSDAYIAYGTRAKDYLVQLGAQGNKIFIGWNSVDNSYFESNSMMTAEEKMTIKSSLGIKAGKVLLYVGQLIERKGIYHLVEAFSKIKKEFSDVSLLIVGKGMEESKLKKNCDKKGLRDVVFAGFVDYKQLPKYYGISDLFVLPSSEEVWGLVINEAMACGLPVITTEKVGASIDLVDDGVNGFVVREKHSAELYEAMKKIITDDELRLKMGGSSKRIISNFNIEHTVEGISDALSYVSKKAV